MAYVTKQKKSEPTQSARYAYQNDTQYIIVVQEGFEPSLTEPESGVLPLHHWTLSQFDVQRCKIFCSIGMAHWAKEGVINILLHTVDFPQHTDSKHYIGPFIIKPRGKKRV